MFRALPIALSLLLASTPVLRADSLFDEGRLQDIVSRQAPTLVRVKAAVEEREAPDAKKDAKSDKAKTLVSKSDAKEELKTFLRLGTGFFISADGQIITNASIVDQARRVWYESDGIAYLAEVKGIDIPTNTALLQAKTMPIKITPVNLADSVSLPQIGSLLVRLSLPMDFAATPTVGITQGADTQFGPHAFPTRYLRVQFNTGPGEAGSPVFDLQGHFAGFTVAVAPELGATYVLPARALSYVRENMTAAGRIYSYFGFNVEEENTATDGRRLVVKTVDDKGPAAVAGLKVGDVVTEASRRMATSVGDLRDAAFFTKPGQYLDLKVHRGNSDAPISIQAIEKK